MFVLLAATLYYIGRYGLNGGLAKVAAGKKSKK